jgi:riboflavin kinase/FMN adenylyltransferase
MIIKNSIEEVSNIPKVITIGNFDGIHKGHQSLINKTCEIASENHLESLVFTFDQLYLKKIISKDYTAILLNLNILGLLVLIHYYQLISIP